MASIVGGESTSARILGQDPSAEPTSYMVLYGGSMGSTLAMSLIITLFAVLSISLVFAIGGMIWLLRRRRRRHRSQHMCATCAELKKSRSNDHTTLRAKGVNEDMQTPLILPVLPQYEQVSSDTLRSTDTNGACSVPGSDAMRDCAKLERFRELYEGHQILVPSSPPNQSHNPQIDPEHLDIAKEEQVQHALKFDHHVSSASDRTAVDFIVSPVPKEDLWNSDRDNGPNPN